MQRETKSRCFSVSLRIKRRMRSWMSGSENAATYRLHAAHCAAIAQKSSDPEARASLTKMSVAWLRAGRDEPRISIARRDKGDAVVITGVRNPAMREPRNRVVQVRRFGGPDGLEVIEA